MAGRRISFQLTGRFAPDDFRCSCKSFQGIQEQTLDSREGLAAPKFQGENFYKNKAIVEEMVKLAKRKGCSLPQIALAWVAAQGMIAIPGTTKPARLVENFSSRDIDLTEEEKKKVRALVEAAKPKGNRYSETAQAMVGHYAEK